MGWVPRPAVTPPLEGIELSGYSDNPYPELRLGRLPSLPPLDLFAMPQPTAQEQPGWPSNLLDIV